MTRRRIVDLSILAALACTAFYAVLVVYSGLEEIISGFKRVQLEGYPLIFLLSFAVYFVLAARYHYLLRTIGADTSLKDSLLVSFSGQSMFATFGRAGTIVKSYLLKKIYGHPISKTGPIVLAEQFLDLKSSVLVLLLASIWFRIFEVQLLLAAGVALTVILYCIMRHDGAFGAAKTLFARVRFLKKFTDGIDESRRSAVKLLSAKTLAVATAASFAVKMLQVAIVFLIFESMGLDIEFLESGMIYFASMLAGIITLLPGGIMVTDSSMVGLLAGRGTELSTSSVAVIITRFVTLWFTVIVGMISLKATLWVFRARFG